MQHAFTDRLGISYPIVQSAMLGISTPNMVAAVSNSGGLGSLPVGGLSLEATGQLIKETKELTKRPFAVNLFANDPPEIKMDEIMAMEAFLEAYCVLHQFPFSQLNTGELVFHSYQELIPVLLEEQVPIISFTFGVLDGPSLQALKNRGTVLIGTATSVKEALFLEQLGVDAITAQGVEAGGHRGTFLEHASLPLIGLLSLVAQMVEQVKVPVIAAGGIYNGNTIRAAFDAGSQAVQIGTAFIASHESAAILSYKKALKTASETDLVLTKAISGRPARGLVNTLIKDLEAAGLPFPAYPIQGNLTAALRQAAQLEDRHSFTQLWAGQSASKAEEKSCVDIFDQLLTEAGLGKTSYHRL